MRARPPRRASRRSQAGLTLIEMIVTIAIMTVGVVGIAYGLAGAEKSAGIAQDQSNLEVAMRQFSDYMRSSSSGAVMYVPCATAYSPPAARPTGIISWSDTVVESTAASRNGSPLPKPAACPSGAYDWGVQEITLHVSSAGRSLTRIVWKTSSG